MAANIPFVPVTTLVSFSVNWKSIPLPPSRNRPRRSVQSYSQWKEREVRMVKQRIAILIPGTYSVKQTEHNAT